MDLGDPRLRSAIGGNLKGSDFMGLEVRNGLSWSAIFVYRGYVYCFLRGLVFLFEDEAAQTIFSVTLGVYHTRERNGREGRDLFLGVISMSWNPINRMYIKQKLPKKKTQRAYCLTQ